MPLTDEFVRDWADHRGHPWLYYKLSRQQLAPWVLRSGLRPRDETGIGGVQPSLASRPGHVYLSTEDDPDYFWRAGMGHGLPDFRVDIRCLDPGRFDSDEDKITAHADSHAEVDDLPGAGSLVWPAPRTPAVAPWIDEQTAIVDAPAWVEFSLESGSVAYRGGIERALLELVSEIERDWAPASGTSWPEEVPTWGPGMPYRLTSI